MGRKAPKLSAISIHEPFRLSIEEGALKEEYGAFFCLNGNRLCSVLPFARERPRERPIEAIAEKGENRCLNPAREGRG